MKFTLFFLTLSLYTLWYFIENIKEVQSFFILWLVVNFLIMTLAYALNKPSWIMGKNQKGEIAKTLLILNLPWLLFTWIIFWVQMLLSRENRVNEIISNHIYIASRPLKGFNYKPYDLIIDLTAEFLKDSVNSYICYPNLDGMALSQSYKSIEIFKNKRVLVHCANGHGRSALFVAGLLVDLELVESFDEGLYTIKQCRPLATVPNGGQIKEYEQKK